MSDVLRVRIDELEKTLRSDLLQLQRARRRALPWADVAALVDAADDIRRAVQGDTGAPADQGPGLLPAEVLCGSIWLRQPTIAASILLARVHDWDVPDPWRYWYMAYVLSHAYDEPALRRVATKPAADDLLADWAISLTCTTDDIIAAIHQLTYGATPPPPPGSSSAADSSNSGGKKNGASLTTPPPSAPLSPRPAAPPATGSTTYPRPTPPGSSAPSPTTTAASPRPSAKPPAAPSPRIRTAPSSSPSPATASSRTDSSPPAPAPAAAPGDSSPCPTA